MQGRDDSGGDGVSQDNDPSEDMISPAQLMRYLGQASRAVEREDEHDDGDDTNRLPRITRMPDGIKVEEHRVGRAVAQWVLHVRCDCGRRWFEVEAVDTTSCPRCGMLVYVDVDARSARK